MTSPERLTARQVEAALWLHFTGAAWAPLAEVTIEPDRVPYGHPDWGKQRPRRIDMLLLRKARKPERDGAIERLAVEIKVTRADFLSDIARPEKQQPWREFAHRHAYATPAGLVEPREVPAGSGLLQIDTSAFGRTVSWAKRAPYGDRPADLPNWLVMGLAYRLGYSEARLRGHTVRQQGAPDNPDELRAEIERLTAENRKLDKDLRKATGESKAWRIAAVKTGVPCSTCRELLRPDRIRHGSFTRWRHVNTTHDATCHLLRHAAGVEAAKISAERNGRAADDWQRFLHIPDPEPIDPLEDL